MKESSPSADEVASAKVPEWGGDRTEIPGELFDDLYEVEEGEADPGLVEREPTAADAAEDGAGALNLLHRLDRRQNEVLTELDRLNAAIEDLVRRCQEERIRDQVA